MALINNIPACKDKTVMYHLIRSIYVLSFIFFIILGILCETNTILRNKYEDSVWWHGVIGLLVILFGVIFFNRSFYYIGITHKSYFWKVSHFLAYLSLTIVAPEQWPFWVAIGIAWEFIECYTLCWPNNTMDCNGYSDIATNICGVAIGLLIKSHRLP
jgi:hypothetical protein